ncbi:hypothetical protein G7Z17_g8857 [Cylindrodendrum hubeiense]|uniref:DOMON domain-containing protein n=1 Tax=Cylindrodendrum hubeiense TaxID=595255 RepID=A0A9P5H8W0_9HYPO|nr:hypothetical protein G7Z17_g8857 [Cylindrodendrum hubeiense]
MKSHIGTLAAAATAVLYARGTSATTSSFCPGSGDVCYRWGVPEAAASSGSGDVYFQIKAPTTNQWVGVGIGSQMSGAEIFVIYQDGSGNVTLSTRSGRGHVMPQYSQRSAVELLSGSGVSGSEMTANIRCGDCSSLDLSGTNSWIAAWKAGDSLDSTSPSETITEHDSDHSFSVDFSSASFSTSGNPFVSGSSSDSGSNSDSNSDSNSGSNSGSGSGSDGAVTENKSSNSDTMANAHGIVMAIVFVIAYPIGAVVMPLLGKWFIHAGWQFLAFLGMWAGFGLGYVAARDDAIFWKNTHTKMGTIVCALLGLQPVLGWAHHQYFRKHQQRGLISHGHIWYGRILMVLGVVNGGLGLELASSPRSLTIAYSVVAAIVSILYVAGTLVGGMRKRRQSAKRIVSPQMTHEEQHSLSDRTRPRYQ